MSYIARLCLLCGIGADYHLKKTEDLCKKIAKSFVKPNLGNAQCARLSTAGVDRSLLKALVRWNDIVFLLRSRQCFLELFSLFIP
jgi:hypothetical protein